MKQKVSIIGAGFSGLSSASVLAQEGFEVHVFEKHNIPGGRARKFSENGFTFDMGPSWYWMPDVFERFFNRFGKKTEDFYTLERLDPAYRVFYGKDDYLDVPSGRENIIQLFESIEKGSGEKLDKYLQQAEYKYQAGVNDLVYKPALSFTEFLKLRYLKDLFRLDLFKTMDHYVKENFRDPRIYPLLQFPVIFLGATPKRTPALYSLMNYSDFELGTWYPKGGMYQVVEAMYQLAESLGVIFHFNSEVTEIQINKNRIEAIVINGEKFMTDFLIASADYRFVEQKLLPAPYRKYSEKYWESREMSPSSLIFYLGINKKLQQFRHHTLFFHESFEQHANAIFEHPEWPEKPLLYTSCTSMTDPSTAPEGMENLMVLIPVASGLKDTEETRNKYYQLILNELERLTGQNIRDHVVFKKIYAHNDFEKDYHAFKGNAYGLGNTLMQTAFLKPSIRNKKLPNLLYTGQLTTPGPGVPPTIISGQVVSDYLIKNHLKR
ncbi:MAG TPA: phytoene desaturase family protein [Bacteroidia bacterium]|nr:phytoene desaturase family protein [Bacteroidia bacterium]HRS59915.1 phytoene desaturase family protein [Bacteroidia bacterium]